MQGSSRSAEPIDTVVFDLGAVLIDWNPRHLYRKLFSSAMEMEEFLETVCTGDWNSKQDAGRPFAEAVRELIELHPGQETLIRAYHERWTEMISGPIQGTVDVLEKLRASHRYRLFALTNWSAETFPYARKRFPFLDLFEGIVVSGEEKLIKPDAELYRILIQRHQLQPAQSVFIDDSEKNVQAAQELGFQALLFTSPSGLEKDLQALGLAF